MSSPGPHELPDDLPDDDAGEVTELAEFLASCPPLSSLGADRLRRAAGQATVAEAAAGEVILDAFGAPVRSIVVIMRGRVHIWHDPGAHELGDEAPDELLGRTDLFGFSSMLTGRSIGPLAVAATDVRYVRLPSAAVTAAFVSPEGVRYLAERISDIAAGGPAYAEIEELIPVPPLVVDGSLSVAETARAMTAAERSSAAVRLAPDRLGVVTDRVLRRTVATGEHAVGSPVADVADDDPVVVAPGHSAADAMIALLESRSGAVVVAGEGEDVHGVLTATDFLVAPTAPGASLHEQLRQADSIETLHDRFGQVPAMLSAVLSQGLAPTKVITLYSTMIDALVRRVLQLVLEDRPGFSSDAFTWLSLGSNGRREAVPSSDIDAAVVFDDRVTPARAAEYVELFAVVEEALVRAGISRDTHGVTPARPLFARTAREWSTAAEGWMTDPTADNGAMMTSLLVDGRPIHGDPTLPSVTRVVTDLRHHPGTMRLLLKESLSRRARPRTMRDVIARSDRFDVKRHALLPIVNLARWAALASGSVALPTVDRLAATTDSEVLPVRRARILIEVFEVLQGLRLRYQLRQVEAGEPPSDVLLLDRLSSIDRSVISRAVQEIAAAQRRADNIAAYLPTDQWTTGAGG